MSGVAMRMHPCQMHVLLTCSHVGGRSSVRQTECPPDHYVAPCRAMVTFAFLLGMPMLSSTVAFSAVVSISTVGLYISCEYLTQQWLCSFGSVYAEAC